MAKRDQRALVQLKVRMREPLRARVEEDAKRRGVSINAEIVDRLERSFDRQGLLSEVLSLEFGKELAGVLMLLGAAMIFADCFHRTSRETTLREPKGAWTWAPDADAYDQAVQAAVTVLEAVRPEGAITNRSGAGVEMANSIIKAVRGDPDAVENGFTSGAPTIRSLLGPIAHRMAKGKSKQEPLRSPFRLALAVMHAWSAIDAFGRAHRARTGSPTLPPVQITEILEEHLKSFLVPDWQQRRGEGQDSAAGPKELAAEIRRRA